MTSNDPWAQTFYQLAAAKPDPAGRIVPENPRPAGVVRRGSSTHAVFELLAECPGRFFEAGEVMTALGLSRGSVSWGLRYLIGQGLVEVVGDPARNLRYLKYSLRENARIPISNPTDQAARIWNRELPHAPGAGDAEAIQETQQTPFTGVNA